MLRRHLLAACLTVCVAWPSDWHAVKHVRNFDQVNERIYRSGQPDQVGLLELGAFGIKRVIDLREIGKQTEVERAALSRLGIKYVNVPMSGFSAPSRDQIDQVLEMLNQGPYPTLVHCLRGKDRTGTVIACYRIQHDGWSNERALEEAKAHGLSSWERGMRSFILRFQAAAQGTSPLSGTTR